MIGRIGFYCHLEFSDLRSPLPASKSFAEWIGAVVKHRVQASNDLNTQRSLAIQSGALDAWNTGTRFILDTVTAPWQSDWISQATNAILNRLSPLARAVCGDTPIQVVPCAEVLDINQTRKKQTLAFYHQLRSQHSSIHLSPHSPYTTSNSLVNEAVSLANQSDAIVSMHLAESKDEMEWLANRQGPFQTRLAPFRDAPFNEDRSTLADYMQSLAKADRLLIAHGNYLTSTELKILAQKSSSAAIVHCPRTYRHFEPEGRDVYPLINRQAQGVQHFLGTDSRASNPDLSMWREFQSIAQQSEQTPGTIIELLASMTVAPAAFFRRTDVGSIEPGASALLNCITNPAGWPSDPEQLLRSLANTMLHPRPIELQLSEIVSN
ncbi:MAG: amidohydrolase family protein [Pirellula sp.]|nr:amidohydrolase family protein [Pirellula sp.]